MAALDRTPIGNDKPTVLVIDDNVDQWFIIRWSILQRFPEVDPVWFADPAEAIIYLEACLESAQKLPQLILLDLYLPSNQVGLQTLKLLKKPEKLYSETPLVVLSQFGDAEEIRTCYGHGANSYITKPLMYSQWLECFAAFRNYWWNQVDLPSAKPWITKEHDG